MAMLQYTALRSAVRLQSSRTSFSKVGRLLLVISNHIITHTSDLRSIMDGPFLQYVTTVYKAVQKHRPAPLALIQQNHRITHTTQNHETRHWRWATALRQAADLVRVRTEVIAQPHRKGEEEQPSHGPRRWRRREELRLLGRAR
jgi:hypothetical protein